MAFEANLFLDGKDDPKYRVIKCSYEMTRKVDDYGKPITGVTAGKISVTIESRKDSPFAVWMTSPKLRKEGKLVFEDPTEDAALKELIFKEAYMVEYKEEFGTDEVDKGMIESFTISAQEIEIGEAKHKNNWPK